MRRFALCLLAAVLLAGSPAAAEIPAGPDAYTVFDYRDDLLQYNREQLIDTYRAKGSRNAAWDDLLEEFFEDIAAVRTSNTIDDSRLDPPMRSRDWNSQRRRELQRLGCDEPLFLHVLAAVFAREGKKDQAIEAARRAYEEMVERDYPPIRVMFAAQQLRNVLPEGPEKDQVREQFTRHIHEAILARQPNPFGKRFILDWADLDTIEEAEPAYEAAQRMVDPDPWAYEMVCGLYRIEAAWEARGTGWSSTVTDEGWQGFSEHLDQAREHLTKAWQLNPKFPEAAASMITVCMGGHGGPGESVQLWFDRAVAAQFDYMPAYSKLQYALRPRWGGSYDVMLEHARQCVATGRFETEVPSEVLDILRRIRDDEDGSWAFVDDERIWPMVQRMFEGTLAEPTRQRHSDYWRSYYASCAWRLGRYDVAREQLELLGDKFSGRTSPYVDATPDRVHDWSYARTGAATDVVAAGDAALARGDTAAAMRHYQEAIAAFDLDPMSERYVKHRFQQFRWQEQLEAGEPIVLTPDQDLQTFDGESVVGLNVERGRWASDAQGLFAESQGRGVEARLVNPVGPRWRFSVVVDFGLDDRPQRLSGGIVTWWESDGHNHQFLVKPGTGYRHSRDWYARNWRAAPIPARVTLMVEQWDGERAMFVDNRLVIRDTAHSEPLYPAIGLGTPTLPDGAAVFFEQPTLQVLKIAPAWLEQDPEEAGD